ncbi:hypothetical protein M3936_20055 [Sutcliffiella horikoshii]|uniref:hypothetical protein n=1 Tax=Sutcliffiella horikoshii TaxID=79883 RepID=UPI00204063EA|nr:hypothetical protein [Sutcliffiella horikoshii]MCM3619869.1 hypothetical protein [Sutcliffiella horikoshii]
MFYYGSIGVALGTLLFWWIILLVFQRATNRYPKNSWKRDVSITLAQSVLVVVLFPVLAQFVQNR